MRLSGKVIETGGKLHILFDANELEEAGIQEGDIITIEILDAWIDEPVGEYWIGKDCIRVQLREE